MNSSFSFFLRYILYILGIQMMFNILFLIVYWQLAGNAGIIDALLSLFYGLKLDVSLTGYVMILPTFVLIPFNIFRSGLFKRIIEAYTCIVVLCLVMAYFANLILYEYWMFPIDQTVFHYLSTPGEMLASFSTFQLILSILIISLAMYLFFFRVYLKWVSKRLKILWKRSWIASFLFLLILPSLILPIRGGFASSPVQTGSVYFHSNAFLNHSAINPVWNLVYSLIEDEHLTQTISYYEDEAVREIMDNLHDISTPPSQVLNTASPNIILIILESFGQPIITKLGGDGSAAPNFNKLINEGIFFSKMYAAGIMTDRALPALLSGYPSLPGSSVIYYENKAQELPNLSLTLKSAGYSTAFLYGGDIDFAHMRSYAVISRFEDIIDDKDFPNSISRSNWGVPDQILFERLFEITDQASRPFFHVLLTLSSHHPFDVPMKPVFQGSGDIEKFKNSVYYTDHSLGEFIDKARTRDWWDQTLIVMVADHGTRMGDITSHEDRRFNIPMVWIGGALNIGDTIITKYGSQTDFPVTLLNQMDLSCNNFRFSKDLLSNSSKSFAYYTFNEGIGFVSDSSVSIFSLITGEYIQKEGAAQEGKEDPALAYLQGLLNDFNSK